MTVLKKQSGGQPLQDRMATAGPTSPARASAVANQERASSLEAPKPLPAASAIDVSETAADIRPSHWLPAPDTTVNVPLHETLGSFRTEPPLEAEAASPDESYAGPDAPQPELDVRTARAAIASTLVNTVSQGLRPSQLLGDAGAGTLLGNTVDGFWGVGQQTAVRLIVEGKAPKLEELQADAVRIVAAAANQEAASLIDEATQYGKDKGILFLRNLELKAEWFPGYRPSVEARTIDALFESEDLDHTIFLEAAIRSDFEDSIANIGLGYRYLEPDRAWMLGVNAFYDRQFPIGHERLSIGLEASTAEFTVFGNRYLALSGWKESSKDFEERPLSGWDLGIAGQVPEMEDVRVSLSAFHWDQKTDADRTGLKFMADYDVSSALQLGATLAADDSGEVRGGVRLTYQFGADQSGGGGSSSGSLMDRRLAFVNRENVIRTEERQVPKDYTIAFNSGDVNPSNEASFSFELAGAPLEARYTYRITSSAGGVPVMGSGTVQASPHTITGIDVSGLADGTLTLTIQVTSKQGAVGPEVKAQIEKLTIILGVATSTASASPTNNSPIPFTIVFTEPISGLAATSLALTNGTAANLQSADNITWTVDVTPTGQGAVSLQVPAGAAMAGSRPNTASNTTSVIFDSQGPSGYSVSFQFSPIESTDFQITGGEPGATYSFRIESTGGGTPVTGDGTITSASQQVTGRDLSELGNGTLTLTLTLTDALGNAGNPVSDTLIKNDDAPNIVSVTAPDAGEYDDL